MGSEPAEKPVEGRTQTISAPAEATASPAEPAVDRILALQRTIGNRAVARMVARSVSRGHRRVLSRDTPTFVYQDPGVRQVADQNPSMTSDQRSALESLDQAHGLIKSAWSKLKWEDVSAGAADRVVHPEHIDQGPLGLCGPAAVLNYLAATTPGTFEYDVEAIYHDGKWGSKKINSTLLNTECQPGMNPCDWMMMSALQDLSNDWFDYNGRTSVLPREGTLDIDTAWMLQAFTKVGATSSLWCKLTGVKERTQKVSDLLAKYGDKVAVLVDVDSKTLADESARGSEDHVIRLLKPVVWGDDQVQFEVFSWGRNWKKSYKRENFEHMVDGYLIGAVGSDIAL
jgi:hypothetical protein